MKKKSRFLLLSDLPWLNFVNTRPMRDGARVDLLARPEELAAWIAEDLPAGLNAVTGINRKLYDDAMILRDELAVLAARAAAGRPFPGGSVAALARRLVRTRGSLHLASRKGARSALEFRPDPSEPAALLFPVVRSAAEWLAAGGHPPVKACGNPECVLYFADTTKSGTRRWCTSTSCGNRVRVARHRELRGD